MSCDKSQSELKEIEKLSKINFPKESNLLFYYDNLEFQVVFKIKLRKAELEKFIISNEFRKYDSKKKMQFKNTVKDDFLLERMENNFSPKEKIPKSKYLYLYEKNISEMYLDSSSSILYGIITYGE